jgi:hypothetical protein
MIPGVMAAQRVVVPTAAALIVSSAIPTDAEIDRLNGWAAHKYGLTANLPGGHPYKTTAHTV